MRYGADDLDTVEWTKVAEEHLAIAQDILAGVVGKNPSAHMGVIALAQAHTLQALALMYGWSI